MTPQRALGWAIVPALLFLMAAVLFPLAFLCVHLAATVGSWSAAALRATSPWALNMVEFTLWQSAVSASISAILAVPLAFVLVPLRFKGRRFILSLSILPFALPSLVVAFAFVIAYGNSGYVTSFIHLLGWDVSFLYNRWAIVAAHIFFNLPFCVRALVQAWENIPSHYYNTAELMALSRWQIFWRIEMPLLRIPLLTAAVIVFGYCLGSFGVVLLLGGRPEFTTLEVGIFQLVRYEFDIAAAAILALWQLVLTMLAASTLQLLPRVSQSEVQAPLLQLRRWSWLGVFCMGPYLLFIILPLGALLLDALRGLHLVVWNAEFINGVAQALSTSLLLACASGVASSLLALAFAVGVDSLHIPFLVRWAHRIIWFCMGISPTVLGFCWFLVLATWVGPFSGSWFAVGVVHVVSSLPIAIRLIYPRVNAILAKQLRDSEVIGLPMALFARKVFWPALRSPLAMAAAVAFAFSFGEIAAASLFGGESFLTIPLLLHRLTGAYRFAEAALLSLVLALVCGGLSYWVEKS